MSALVVAYLVGSFPSAYLAGRVLRGIDLRTVGSGNLGATNVYRSLGARAAIAVMLADALKGAIPAAILPGLLTATSVQSASSSMLWGLSFGVAAILGHWKPIFLLGNGGGKGVATAAGVFLALTPLPFLLCFAGFAVTAWRTGIVSLALLVAAALLPIGIALTAGVLTPLFAVGLGVALFVFWAHRANIVRLRAGLEPRTFGKKPQEGA